MIDSYTQLLHTLYNGTWYVVLVSLIVAFAIEHKAVWEMYHESFKAKGQPLQAFYPVVRRSTYIVLGALLTNLSYAIMSIVLNWFPVNTDELSGLSMTTTGNLYFIAVALLAASGYTLSLSVGTKWLITVSKFLATAAFAVLMILVVGSYLM